MTLFQPFGAAFFASRAPQAEQRPHWRLAATAVAVIGLSACGSTPLPPWPANNVPTQPSSRATVPPPLGQSQAFPGVVTSPVEIALPVPDLVTQAKTAQVNAAFENPAVAARFPDPVTRYNTPGLTPDRQAFSTNAEIGQWLQQLTSASSTTGSHASLLAIGASQRGAPIHAAVFTRATGKSPQSLDATKRPTVLLVGQQHGDEPAGSEALLVIAQELARGLLEPLLENINVIIVPRANPDGAEAGTRATANGVDMNRDHLFLNTPEAQALAVLVRDYRPIAVIDAHEFVVAGRYLEKFHALQRYDALLQYATTANLPEFLTKASKEWYHAPMVHSLNGQNLANEWYYTTSARAEDLRLSMGGTQPDTLRNVNGLKNTVSLLVSTRGIDLGHIHIQRRVHTHITAITTALRSTAERAASLEQVRSFVVRDTGALACRDQVTIETAATPEQRNITMLDPQTGADRLLHLNWDSSLTLRSLKSRPRPCGYWLPATAGIAIERLKLLGVQVLRVAEPGSLLADTYREASSKVGSSEEVQGTVGDQGGVARAQQVQLVRSAIDAGAGSYYVPLNQALASLAVAALEPDTQHSYFTNHLIESLADTARVMGTPSLIFEEIE